jgi:hypothetical protein
LLPWSSHAPLPLGAPLGERLGEGVMRETIFALNPLT